MKELSEEAYKEKCANARKASLNFDVPNLARVYMDVLKTTKSEHIGKR